MPQHEVRSEGVRRSQMILRVPIDHVTFQTMLAALNKSAETKLGVESVSATLLFNAHGEDVDGDIILAFELLGAEESNDRFDDRYDFYFRPVMVNSVDGTDYIVLNNKTDKDGQ